MHFLHFICDSGVFGLFFTKTAKIRTRINQKRICYSKSLLIILLYCHQYTLRKADSLILLTNSSSYHIIIRIVGLNKAINMGSLHSDTTLAIASTNSLKALGKHFNYILWQSRCCAIASFGIGSVIKMISKLSTAFWPASSNASE